ncbi:MAG: hypothetical protein PUJ51_05880 [Clostridiales bacterium]|uniref:hypothetical protein n=1 Tax=Terrisporobacter sp. TaxID=1965305 RepID=UPI002A4EAFD3|nr:hypothetical protein [Terrisporobacter sp.]MDD7754020.1 hypothetical protein [Clostridiales bacterium]MDY4133721.1 hypothetical protein [Terrisporobacter sp.]
MDKEEIKDYLKRVDELEAKLTGEDKETFTWLIYGYNQCAKLLNETEQQCKKQKEVINNAIEYINDNLTISSILDGEKYYTINNYSFDYKELLDILNEVSDGNN